MKALNNFISNYERISDVVNNTLKFRHFNIKINLYFLRNLFKKLFKNIENNCEFPLFRKMDLFDDPFADDSNFFNMKLFMSDDDDYQQSQTNKFKDHPSQTCSNKTYKISHQNALSNSCINSLRIQSNLILPNIPSSSFSRIQDIRNPEKINSNKTNDEPDGAYPDRKAVDINQNKTCMKNDVKVTQCDLKNDDEKQNVQKTDFNKDHIKTICRGELKKTNSCDVKIDYRSRISSDVKSNTTKETNETKDDEDDNLFKMVLSNPFFRINPVKLGFIPTSFWTDNDVSFGDIVKIFFRRKNNSKCRFPHKLYNALVLSTLNPRLFNLVGAKWVDNITILISRKRFARLLGIRAIEGSLFHQQGNFPSHGFVEIDPMIVKNKYPNFDFGENRLISHSGGVFVFGCTENDIDTCKWNHANQK
ncbi:hypothetical protein TRFO_16795 [Tritrichomonas foetus]|uniref:Initiator binding domain-containing protein n=1 Tax=Tritrichomonas foetus TaxID=1144522 RepID=A0A1J4KPH5_9EUKA|nr:hypothetical protein TRFO_16795 [Tritrichomonas foetus]|eukprot:OHT13139.1 hypothetical protein TRFO_16795 [Tritrichomonas foetus]